MKGLPDFEGSSVENLTKLAPSLSSSVAAILWKLRWGQDRIISKNYQDMYVFENPAPVIISLYYSIYFFKFLPNTQTHINMQEIFQ